MRFAIAAAALAAISARAVAEDASQVTSTITKTLSIVHTETVYAQSANSTTWSAESKTSSLVEETSAPEPSAAPVATPSLGQNGVNGAAVLSFDMMLAVVAAGAVTFWSL